MWSFLILLCVLFPFCRSILRFVFVFMFASVCFVLVSLVLCDVSAPPQSRGASRAEALRSRGEQRDVPSAVVPVVKPSEVPL